MGGVLLPRVKGLNKITSLLEHRSELNFYKKKFFICCELSCLPADNNYDSSRNDIPVVGLKITSSSKMTSLLEFM